MTHLQKYMLVLFSKLICSKLLITKKQKILSDLEIILEPSPNAFIIQMMLESQTSALRADAARKGLRINPGEIERCPFQAVKASATTMKQSPNSLKCPLDGRVPGSPLGTGAARPGARSEGLRSNLRIVSVPGLGKLVNFRI